VTPQQALRDRIRQLRQRFFGRGGAGEFAARLGISLDEYQQFESRIVPPGDVLVRMCEITGEDLQWLLTGVASRGALVITETRSRHRDLLTRLAELLDRSAHLAPAVEAFLDLLAGGERAAAQPAELPSPRRGELIPILAPDELPNGPLDDAPATRPLLPLDAEAGTVSEQSVVALVPATTIDASALSPAALVVRQPQEGAPREYVRSARLATPPPGAFAVRVGDDSMTPMFAAGDVAVVEPSAGPRVGCPALCRVRGEPAPRCRIWLGRDGDRIHLGRLAGGELEHVPAGELTWALLVLLCVTTRSTRCA
jgi:hypothetical protein